MPVPIRFSFNYIQFSFLY